uniref:CS domain-containing protein n=1 Tax=Craspedostauros australis TaxID=1486917 RepID=A0A7R9WVJ4_9STRA
MPKYQWWQNDKFLTISILEPNVSAADIGVTFEPKRLVITLQKGNANFTVIAGSLYSEINPEKSKTVIKTEKVLVKLRKVDEKFEWRELVGKEDKRDAVKPANTTKAAAKDGEIPIVKESAKTRPYASHRDWDAIEKTLDKEESDEKPVGDEAMNKLFQTIYKDADENTKRAMIKSYQTSGGTVLSTNWDEVAKKDYEKERTAPKGVEWKSWEGKKLPMQDDD